MSYLYNQCVKKSRYSSPELAERVAQKAFRERKVQLRFYACDICMGYHLTKVEPPVQPGKPRIVPIQQAKNLPKTKVKPLKERVTLRLENDLNYEDTLAKISSFVGSCVGDFYFEVDADHRVNLIQALCVFRDAGRMSFKTTEVDKKNLFTAIVKFKVPKIKKQPSEASEFYVSPAHEHTVYDGEKANSDGSNLSGSNQQTG